MTDIVVGMWPITTMAILLQLEAWKSVACLCVSDLGHSPTLIISSYRYLSVHKLKCHYSKQLCSTIWRCCTIVMASDIQWPIYRGMMYPAKVTVKSKCVYVEVWRYHYVWWWSLFLSQASAASQKIIHFAVLVMKVKCILRSKVLLLLPVLLMKASKWWSKTQYYCYIGSAFHFRHYGVYWGTSSTIHYILPAYLGNAFSHV